MKEWLAIFSTTGKLNPVNGYHTITAAQSSEIVSILSAGTFFGALTAAPSCDFFGRKLGLMVSTVVFTFGVVLQTAATAIPLFVAGRFFAGYGVGMISASIPLYQSETAPKWIRGTIVGAYQLAITIGLLLASVVDHSTSGRSDTGSYRIPIAVQFAWALILFFGMLLLPETPRMYIKRGQPEKAAKSLSASCGGLMSIILRSLKSLPRLPPIMSTRCRSVRPPTSTASRAPSASASRLDVFFKLYSS